MTNSAQKSKVIFFGSSRYVLPIIEVLKKNFDLALVATTEKLASPGEALQGYPVIDFCSKNKIPYLSVLNLQNPNLKSYIINHKSPIGVLASFGAIIPSEILNAFPKGILNIHPSLLPKYRGSTPVQAAILNGEKTTGFTIIKLDEEVDHGPILAQEKEPILANDTSESLYTRLFELSTNSIVRTIKLYLEGKIKPYEQDHKQATFTKTLTRQDGFINMSKVKSQPIRQAQDKNSKVKIERMIRAYYPWPGVYTKLKIKNHLPARQAGKSKIIKFLPENKIQVEGGKPMSYKDFANGYPQIANNLEFIIQN